MSMTPPTKNGRARAPRSWPESTSRLHRLRARGPAQRRPHWKVTVLVPSGLVTMLDAIGCEPYFRQ
jgi:hypothetical protein